MVIGLDKGGGRQGQDCGRDSYAYWQEDVSTDGYRGYGRAGVQEKERGGQGGAPDVSWQ